MTHLRELCAYYIIITNNYNDTNNNLKKHFSGILNLKHISVKARNTYRDVEERLR